MAKKDYIEGTISTTGGGVGFLVLEGEKEDVRIEEGHLGTALNGDVVQVKIHPQPEVVKVVERRKTSFVGVLERENGKVFLTPDDKRIHIDFFIPSPPKDTKDGDKALVKFTRWNDPNLNPEAEIIKVLGKKGAHEVEMQSIVLEKGIDTTFPPDVEKEAKEIKQTKGKITQDEIKKRRDFRDTTTFTIDPKDAKDFDDAISIKPTDGNKYEVGIHIADVSHYVKRGTALDKDAQKRAFSTYLVDRTIPMLPEVLSNDLCSLNPDEDKLTFSAVFVLDKNAVVEDRWFGKTIIHSNKRFTYEEAQGILDAKKGTLFKELSVLNDISKKLLAKNVAEGAIEFEQDEFEFELDNRGVPVSIHVKEKLETRKLIEGLMLLANKEVAAFVSKKQNPKGKASKRALIYRVHDKPDKEKLEALKMFLRALGYELGKKGHDITGHEINKLFMDIEGTSEEGLIKTAAIRAMAKAAYSTKNIGHFGLGFGLYTHFTSPIRRYADLLVHRLMTKSLAGETISQEERELHGAIAEELSSKEISVIEAERDSIKYKQVEYMKQHIGKTFDGIITGVSEWGVFVAEIGTGAEGLVRMKDLADDFYELERKKYRLVGKKTKKTYSLGDRVRVKVIGANLDRKTLDYALV